MTPLENIIQNASKLKIAVIGDFIEDRYIIGDVDRISPEAPVPVVKVTNYKSTPGGAGNVFMNLVEMGVEAHLFCDIGHLRDDIKSSAGMSIESMLHLTRRQHCVKTRVMSGNHHMVRFDDEIVPVWRDYADMKWRDDFEAWLLDWDAVIISDYHKGLVSDDVAERVINLCEQYKVPVIVDAKRDFGRFERCTLFKCNSKEWDASGYTLMELLQKLDIKELVVTEGARGLFTFNGMTAVTIEGHKIPIVDTCGAGDTVTAVLAVCKALKIEIDMAGAAFANRLAAEVCKHPGVYPITREDLIKINAEVREPSV
jgi:rfaE bifunctional protein kinase chain/domain